MTTDETMSAGVSGRGGSGKGKGKERANDGQVRPPTRLRPVCTPTTFYKPPDSVQGRVLYEQHFQNVAQEEPCHSATSAQVTYPQHTECERVYAYVYPLHK